MSLKLALCIEQLVERTSGTEVLDFLVDLYPQAEIFTYAHKQGAILGEIEQRRIHSSPISHLAKDLRSFSRYRFLIPHLKKTFYIPCRFDAAIIVSSSGGLIEGIAKEKNIPVLIFQNWESEVRKKTLSERFFSAHLKRWSKRFQGDDFHGLRVEDIPPSIKCREIFCNKEPRKFEHLMVSSEDFTDETYPSLNLLANMSDVPLLVVGRDQHLEKLKLQASSNLHFLGDKCLGDINALLQTTYAVIHMGNEKSSFPRLVVEGLAAGRPYFSNRSIPSLPPLSSDSLFNNPLTILTHLEAIKAENLSELAPLRRNLALNFDQTYFEIEWKKRWKGFLINFFP